MFVRLMGLWLPGAVLLDMAAPIAARAFGWGFQVTAYFSLAIIVGEGLMLRGLDRSQRWKATWIAVIAMNATSTIAGIVVAPTATDTMYRLGNWLAGVRGGNGRYGYAESLSDPGALVDWFAAFAVLWLGTTLIEAVVLHIVRRDGRPWRSLGHSAAVNAVSYALLAVGLLLVMQRPFTPPL